ncbi:hypothetical protein B0H13DRAFT_1920893 [Mycena leptocephala]|nr:hypothetical protein B0H13DRAFT_1920893 [Mycena leptocephala]
MYATVIYCPVDTGANTLLNIKKHKFISQQDLADGRGLLLSRKLEGAGNGSFGPVRASFQGLRSLWQSIRPVSMCRIPLEISLENTAEPVWARFWGCSEIHNFVHESVVARNSLAAEAHSLAVAIFEWFGLRDAEVIDIRHGRLFGPGDREQPNLGPVYYSTPEHGYHVDDRSPLGRGARIIQVYCSITINSSRGVTRDRKFHFVNRELVRSGMKRHAAHAAFCAL